MNIPPPNVFNPVLGTFVVVIVVDHSHRRSRYITINFIDSYQNQIVNFLRSLKMQKTMRDRIIART